VASARFQLGNTPFDELQPKPENLHQASGGRRVVCPAQSDELLDIPDRQSTTLQLADEMDLLDRPGVVDAMMARGAAWRLQ
jgi:hypothetical protein